MYDKKKYRHTYVLRLCVLLNILRTQLHPCPFHCNVITYYTVYIQQQCAIRFFHPSTSTADCYICFTVRPSSFEKARCLPLSHYTLHTTHYVGLFHYIAHHTSLQHSRYRQYCFRITTHNCHKLFDILFCLTDI